MLITTLLALSLQQQIACPSEWETLILPKQVSSCRQFAQTRPKQLSFHTALKLDELSRLLDTQGFAPAQSGQSSTFVHHEQQLRLSVRHDGNGWQVDVLALP
jgi:hypothetical protein